MASSDPKELVSHLLNEVPVKTTPIRAGRNSRVFRVDCQSGKTLLAKFYLQPTADGRSRLAQEWSALKFMTENGIKNIPRPIAFDQSLQGAIYSFVHGERVTQSCEHGIREILSFLSKLKEISTQANAVKISPAAEACFSPAQLVGNIEERLKKLQALPAEDELYRQLHSFLDNNFAIRFAQLTDHTKQMFPGGLWTEPLAQQHRTLSPSDFGFHNAIKNESGFTFVDFEYFGWDDPVKSTADFLLHPAMDLSERQPNVFFSGMEKLFKADRDFTARFKVYVPLLCLKWCMIILNEFITGHMERREFAVGKTSGREKIRARQLEKALNFLNKDQRILCALNLAN
ncbi:phosphotransferase [Maridesulfovibrio sp.]|uniref:phosphotransferase n=1 Tax=unclassified Maridesulfovibrio TaxID=2794999 RepID=UPI003AFFBAFC